MTDINPAGTDRRLVHDLNSLVDRHTAPATLRVVPPPNPIAANVGRGRPTDAAGTAGIASPLTETAYADRVHYAPVTITSSDGLFTLEVKRIKTLKMLDANGRPVTLEFKAPL